MLAGDCAKTFGLTPSFRQTKDFAPGRFQRDQSGVVILRNAPRFSPNHNAASVAGIDAQGLSARFFKYRLAIAGATR
jgi:hypothetical protein